MQAYWLYRLNVISIFVTLTVMLYLSRIYRSSTTPEPKSPVILSWTAFFEDGLFMTPDLKQLKCPVSNCVLTLNKTLVESADAVVFHWRDLDVLNVPKTKPQNQRWILLNFESPVFNDLDILANISSKIDWTATYRLDSEFYTPYGCIRPRRDTDPPVEKLNEDHFNRKSSVAWMVSNCASKSKREELALKIMKLIRVDVYGNCAPNYGQTTRPLFGEDRLQVYAYLAERYKFYLSFENSICEDYITEKAYLPLQAGMIPVVFGGANYQIVLPPKSFINARNFRTPKLLAQHLTEVSKNIKLYRQYMKWRENFLVESCEMNRFFCDLCARLHNKNSGVAKQNLLTLWNANSTCQVL